MRSTISLILQALLLLVIGTGIGFAANAARQAFHKPAIVLGQQYFYRPSAATKTVPSDGATPDNAARSGEASVVATDGHGSDGEGTDGTGRSSPTAPKSVADDEPAHPPHEFQPIDTAGVEALVDGTVPLAASTIFVDARDDKEFREGHIPGAYPCYFSTMSKDFEAFRELAVDAGYTLVVYCNGGNCEDSINLCRILVYEKAIPKENVFLYEGGWKAWEAGDHPIEKGPRGGSDSSDDSE